MWQWVHVVVSSASKSWHGMSIGSWFHADDVDRAVALWSMHDHSNNSDIQRCTAYSSELDHVKQTSINEQIFVEWEFYMWQWVHVVVLSPSESWHRMSIGSWFHADDDAGRSDNDALCSWCVRQSMLWRFTTWSSSSCPCASVVRNIRSRTSEMESTGCVHVLTTDDCDRLNLQHTLIADILCFKLKFIKSKTVLAHWQK